MRGAAQQRYAKMRNPVAYVRMPSCRPPAIFRAYERRNVWGAYAAFDYPRERARRCVHTGGGPGTLPGRTFDKVSSARSWKLIRLSAWLCRCGFLLTGWYLAKQERLPPRSEQPTTEVAGGLITISYASSGSGGLRPNHTASRFSGRGKKSIGRMPTARAAQPQ